MSTTLPLLRRLPVRAAATIATGAAVTLVTVLGAPASGVGVRGRELDLRFNSSLRHNSGHAVLDISRVRDNGGRVRLVRGRNGRGHAARFPAFKMRKPPQAVLRVVDNRRKDNLNPGTADFSFGASFSLDATSVGSRTDNGDNLIQRGLFNAQSQYKLQVDNGVPECRIKGSAGTVEVLSPRAVARDRWYRVTCSRQGSVVTMVVKRLDKRKKWTYRSSGPTGDLRPVAKSVPLSIGGKLLNSGALLSKDADQFNGVVDNAFLNIG